jgi:LmbE family N-acetylglucosaminyl deacetylase
MRVLIVSVHPDDETVGCGGTILKHREAGDSLFWLIATQAFEPDRSAEIIQRKADEVAAVAQSYRFAEVYKLGLPTTRLDTLPQVEVMASIREVACQVKPDWIYLVNRSDVHSDHRLVFEAAMAVFKPFFREFGTTRILCYECLSSTDAAPALPERAFVPNVFSDITSWVDRKIEIMRLYETEAQPDPLPRGPSAIRALARYRGATIGVEYAEAFMLIRELM